MISSLELEYLPGVTIMTPFGIIFFMQYTYFADLGSWFFISFIISLFLGTIASSVLYWLNSDKPNLKAKVGRLHSLGETARKVLPYGKIRKALRYKRTVDGFSDLVDTVDSSVTLLALLFGVLPFLVALFHAILPSVGMVWCFIAATAVMSMATTLLGAPVEYYEDFVIEQKYGFNTMTLKTFVADKLKSLPIGIAMSAALYLVLDWALRHLLGDGGVTAAGFVLFLVGAAMFKKVLQWTALNVVMPLFNEFKPLDDGPLKSKLESMCRRCGVKIARIEVMDASKRSKHSNAFICGSFGKKRIVLFDTLLKNFTDDEIVSVVAHEIGHGKLHHLPLKDLEDMLLTTAYAFLSFALVANPGFYHAFGYSWVDQGNLVGNYVIGFALASVFLKSFTWVLAPVTSWISRKMEYAADRYAVEHTGNVESMKNALLKLTAENLSDVFPHPAYEAVYYSHPSIINRVEALDGSKERNKDM